MLVSGASSCFAFCSESLVTLTMSDGYKINSHCILDLFFREECVCLRAHVCVCVCVLVVDKQTNTRIKLMCHSANKHIR